MRATLVLVVLICACARSSESGVPNLLLVRSRVLRSGQPPPGSWSYLAGLGVTDVIKLDFDDEGLDTGALAADVEVHYVPIQPSTRLGIGVVEDVFSEPDRSTLLEIERLVREIRNVPTKTWLIHCWNGRDRTGLVVGMIRMMVDGWDKRRAWREMLDRGYHPELLGLDRAWWEFSPEERVP